MGWTPLLDGIDVPEWLRWKHYREEASTKKVSIIGLDLAKNTIQDHGACALGTVVFRRKVLRTKLLGFLASFEACMVAMEACAGAHYWGRQIMGLGHTVHLIAPAYVKPFVKRQKNDAADAEAICEAAMRSTMRFVAVKSENKQASAVVFKVRDIAVRQKTQLINALRGHLTEFGIVVPQGPSHVAKLLDWIDDAHSDLPEAARCPCLMLVTTLRALMIQIAELDQEIARRARHDDVAERLMTIPGIGPVIATTLEAMAPPAETFVRGRELFDLVWPDATPTFDGWQGSAWKDIKNGST